MDSREAVDAVWLLIAEQGSHQQDEAMNGDGMPNGRSTECGMPLSRIPEQSALKTTSQER